MLTNLLSVAVGLLETIPFSLLISLKLTEFAEITNVSSNDNYSNFSETDTVNATELNLIYSY